MSVKYDGGLAFPRAGFDSSDRYCEPKDGMSLRDWLAGLALQAWRCRVCSAGI
jgi:hypothetical protein